MKYPTDAEDLILAAVISDTSLIARAWHAIPNPSNELAALLWHVFVAADAVDEGGDPDTEWRGFFGRLSASVCASTPLFERLCRAVRHGNLMLDRGRPRRLFEELASCSRAEQEVGRLLAEHIRGRLAILKSGVMDSLRKGDTEAADRLAREYSGVLRGARETTALRVAKEAGGAS